MYLHYALAVYLLMFCLIYFLNKTPNKPVQRLDRLQDRTGSRNSAFLCPSVATPVKVPVLELFEQKGPSDYVGVQFHLMRCN